MKRTRLESIERQLGLTGSLYSFVKMAWHIVEPNTKYLDNWHVEEICKHLEACSRRELRQLVINVPPGHMKSLLVSVFWPVWHWIRDPGAKWFFGADDSKLVQRDASRALDLINSPWFRRRWGDRVTVDPKSGLEHYDSVQGGWRHSTSIRKKIVGWHFHFKVLDDPNKPGDLTDRSLEEVQEWRKGTLAGRSLEDSVDVIIMQRLHEKDAAGHAVEEGYTHLCLPAEFDSASACVTPWGGDRRTSDGELLWPSLFNEERIAKQKKDMGPSVAAAQLQQRPAPKGGLIFQDTWIRRYTTLPSDLQMICSWDCTFKDTEGSDFVAGHVWGWKGPSLYLVDRVYRRLDFVDTLKQIVQMKDRYPKSGAILIEDKANGPAVMSVLEKQIPGIVAVTPQGGKIARANAITHVFEAGNVFIPEGGWADEFWLNMKTFPRGAHDDDVDACSQAISYILEKGSRLSEALANTREWEKLLGGSGDG